MKRIHSLIFGFGFLTSTLFGCASSSKHLVQYTETIESATETHTIQSVLETLIPPGGIDLSKSNTEIVQEDGEWSISAGQENNIDLTATAQMIQAQTQFFIQILQGLFSMGMGRAPPAPVATPFQFPLPQPTPTN